MAPGASLNNIAIFLLLCCSACSSHGFFFNPDMGRRHRSYLQGEEIHALVAPMSSLLNMLPVDYYSLPSCKPPRGGVGSPARNLGEMLLPDGAQNSPYRFRINVNESLYLCTTDPLTAQDLDLLLQRKFHHYAVHMVLDDLPLTSLDRDYSLKTMRGFFLSHMRVYPVDVVYVINHLKFRISLHKQPSASLTRYEIVGFEVIPCSVGAARHPGLSMYDSVDPPDCRWDVAAFVEARRGERLTFTYEVEYLMSSRSWNSRLDPYYQKVQPDHVRSFFLLRSLGTLLIFVVLFFVKLWRSTLRELTTFCGASNSEGSRLLQREGDRVIPGWKLIAGDVFRVPNCAKLLCVAVGTGVEIILAALMCTTLGVLGFIYPAPRGILLSWILLLYLLFGFVGGYVGVWLWGSITGNYGGWRSVCYWMAAFFPGVVFFIAGLLNLAYWGKGSSFASATVDSYLCVLALWACVLLPSTCGGGFLATNHKPVLPPVEANIVPRKIPPRQLLSWLFTFVLGCLPFSFILDELFPIIHSICYGWYYSSPEFLLAATLLLAAACILTSVLVTYNHIYASDWKWWWRSLLASGATGIYIFLYAVKYLVFNLRGFVSEAPLSIAVYLGCSAVAALAVMLATGAIGFLAAASFVRFLYAFSKV